VTASDEPVVMGGHGGGTAKQCRVSNAE